MLFKSAFSYYCWIAAGQWKGAQKFVSDSFQYIASPQPRPSAVPPRGNTQKPGTLQPWAKLQGILVQHGAPEVGMCMTHQWVEQALASTKPCPIPWVKWWGATSLAEEGKNAPVAKLAMVRCYILGRRGQPSPNSKVSNSEVLHPWWKWAIRSQQQS